MKPVFLCMSQHWLNGVRAWSVQAFLIMLSGLMLLTFDSQASFNNPHELAQLKKRLDQVMEQSKAPGASINIVNRAGESWQYNYGVRDTKTGKPVTSGSLFQAGSVAKVIVAIAIMQQVEQGKLTLDADISHLLPEFEFSNPWQSEHPVTVEHLLLHATGWDAPHPSLMAGFTGNTALTTKQQLAAHPETRTSRWVPGSRQAYNNTGAVVAARIVEVLSGLTFEQYVRQYLFDPAAMPHTGYLNDRDWQQQGTAGYRNGRRAQTQTVFFRAAGGLKTSSQELSRLVLMMLNNGQLDDHALLSASSVNRMTSPERSGLDHGFTPGLKRIHHRGFMFNAHDGAVPGSQALIAWQSDIGIGHVILVNSEGPVINQLQQVVADYETKQYVAQRADIKKPESAKATRALTDDEKKLAGFYRVISTVSERWAPFSQLVAWRLLPAGDALLLGPAPGGKPRRLIPGENGQLLQQSTGQPVLRMTNDPLAGPVLTYGPMTLQRVSGLSVWGPRVILMLTVLTSVIAVICLLFWLPSQIRRSGGFTAGLAASGVTLKLWPAINGLVILTNAAVLLLVSQSPNVMAALTQVSTKTLWVFLSSLLVPVLSGVAAWCWIQQKHAVGKFHRWFGLLAILAQLAFSLWLVSNGLVLNMAIFGWS